MWEDLLDGSEEETNLPTSEWTHRPFGKNNRPKVGKPSKPDASLNLDCHRASARIEEEVVLPPPLGVEPMLLPELGAVMGLPEGQEFVPWFHISWRNGCVLMRN